MRRAIGHGAIELAVGDITLERVDAIVNAANTTLLGGGGVDGAIHRAGGPAILAECEKIGGCPPGEARMTTAGRLGAKFVIHAVGPIYRGGDQGEAELLAACYGNSLDLAQGAGLNTISFPAISCGVYGYPLLSAARIAVGTVRKHLAEREGIRLVRFVLYTEQVYGAFEQALKEVV